MAWQLGDYCTVSDLKSEVRIDASNTTDDALLEELIREASREIERFTFRRFYASAETRYYHALNHTMLNRLLLDEDLVSITTITLGDGTAVDTDDYVLEPYNYTPKVNIVLKSSSGKSWQIYDEDPEMAIAVAGSWGYNSGSVPPDDIRRAAIKFARWRYLEKRTNPTTEQAGMAGENEFNVTSSLPKDIQRMLLPYRRPQLAAVQEDF